MSEKLDRTAAMKGKHLTQTTLAIKNNGLTNDEVVRLHTMSEDDPTCGYPLPIRVVEERAEGVAAEPTHTGSVALQGSVSLCEGVPIPEITENITLGYN